MLRVKWSPTFRAEKCLTPLIKGNSPFAKDDPLFKEWLEFAGLLTEADERLKAQILLDLRALPGTLGY
jgi:hypothetical protein